jgi:hypothetical protein
VDDQAAATAAQRHSHLQVTDQRHEAKRMQLMPARQLTSAGMLRRLRHSTAIVKSRMPLSAVPPSATSATPCNRSVILKTAAASSCVTYCPALGLHPNSQQPHL